MTSSQATTHAAVLLAGLTLWSGCGEGPAERRDARETGDRPALPIRSPAAARDGGPALRRVRAVVRELGTARGCTAYSRRFYRDYFGTGGARRALALCRREEGGEGPRVLSFERVRFVTGGAEAIGLDDIGFQVTAQLVFERGDWRIDDLVFAAAGTDLPE